MAERLDIFVMTKAVLLASLLGKQART